MAHVVTRHGQDLGEVTDAGEIAYYRGEGADITGETTAVVFPMVFDGSGYVTEADVAKTEPAPDETSDPQPEPEPQSADLDLDKHPMPGPEAA